MERFCLASSAPAGYSIIPASLTSRAAGERSWDEPGVGGSLAPSRNLPGKWWGLTMLARDLCGMSLCPTSPRSG